MGESVSASSTFEQHAVRGRFNAAFFGLLDPYIEWTLRRHKQRVFSGLPRRVVEIGSGVGANLRYLPDAATLIAIEPNRYMHVPLQTAARRHGVRLDLRPRTADDTRLPDGDADVVISSLVLCSVPDPAAVLAEVRRILRPGGTFRFPNTSRRRRGRRPERCSAWSGGRGVGCSRAVPASAIWRASSVRRASTPSRWSGTESTARSCHSTPTSPASRFGDRAPILRQLGLGACRWRGPGPFDPAGYSSIGTSSRRQASRTG